EGMIHSPKEDWEKVPRGSSDVALPLVSLLAQVTLVSASPSERIQNWPFLQQGQGQAPARRANKEGAEDSTDTRHEESCTGKCQSQLRPLWPRWELTNRCGDDANTSAWRRSVQAAWRGSHTASFSSPLGPEEPASSLRVLPPA
uniref:Uncharacterized protein n=1 Tax=Oryctolagus cuniculus TaxID=9986 RepID=A0A5F9DQ65_RABIT